MRDQYLWTVAATTTFAASPVRATSAKRSMVFAVVM
jgi:hypothetical protein